MTLIARPHGSAKTPFQSELWRRLPMESNHLHGHAMDVTAPPFPIGPLRIKSGYRTLEEQRELARAYARQAPILPWMAAARGPRFTGPVALPRKPVALWGGRKGSLQFGSPEDRYIERLRKRRANIYRIVRLAETALLKRELVGHRTPGMEGLLAMGRELDLIWT